MHFLPYNKTLKEFDVKKNMPYVLAEIGYFIDDLEKKNGVLQTSF